MQPIKGVVSDRSLQALLTWLYFGQAFISNTEPQQQITEVIELTRLLDMCLMRGTDLIMVEIIRQLIFMNPDLQYKSKLITNEHLFSVSRLPRRNADPSYDATGDLMIERQPGKI
ncbi:hypothetical protein N7466_004816 [Penicillium verhagenii]|uniref:uncharacterized protein n=1 Tax=Penicillium verhagenii TaxID=1562060 RepID=UPI00254598EE|nr:uncharacterized protein N7466_004816 [Penicillium verhagenii]KAJ5935269.1 hypothetical protein N7466_004816 [Penicillium verhagenii]